MNERAVRNRRPCNPGARRAESIAVLAFLLVLGLVGSGGAQAAPSACFHVYDATLYAGKPDLVPLGIQHLRLVSPQAWWKAAKSGPDQRRDVVMKETEGLIDSKDPVIVDLELPLASKDPASTANIKLYEDLMDWMRAAGYDKPLAYYASLPLRDYWGAVRGPGSAPYRDWQADNDRLSGIVGKVSALYPSLYTFYPDQEGWAKYARANIAEARRIGGNRPVYPFLWPQYHDSAKGLAHQYLEQSYWTRELQVVGAQADGVVIWGGWDFDKNQPQAWDPTAAWWQATQAYLKSRSDLCKPE
jgi:hypothetical protein